MKSKLMKIATIGLFAVAILLNISVYFDSDNSQNSDLSLGSLKVSLFQKAYAEIPIIDVPQYSLTYTGVFFNGEWITTVNCLYGGSYWCPTSEPV